MYIHMLKWVNICTSVMLNFAQITSIHGSDEAIKPRPSRLLLLRPPCIGENGGIIRVTMKDYSYITSTISLSFPTQSYAVNLTNI
jgi:hypothetical protein